MKRNLLPESKTPARAVRGRRFHSCQSHGWRAPVRREQSPALGVHSTRTASTSRRAAAGHTHSKLLKDGIFGFKTKSITQNLSLYSSRFYYYFQEPSLPLPSDVCSPTLQNCFTFIKFLLLFCLKTPCLCHLPFSSAFQMQVCSGTRNLPGGRPKDQL